ncbi:MAG: hypothetical protein LBN74_08010 [Prevotella sp.]|jgi:hypothetical protein|nr:hypothetical protein [Prevotella sp.]
MDETQAVEIDVQLDKSDIKRYIVHYYRGSIFLQLITFAGAMLIFGFFITFFMPDNPFLSSFFVGLDPLIIGFIAIVLILPFVIYFLLLYTAKRYGLFEKRVYKINDKEINIKTDTKDITVSVLSINRITETKNTFYIWQGKAPLILPKRFMKDSDSLFVRKLKR